MTRMTGMYIGARRTAPFTRPSCFESRDYDMFLEGPQWFLFDRASLQNLTLTKRTAYTILLHDYVTQLLKVSFCVLSGCRIAHLYEHDAPPLGLRS